MGPYGAAAYRAASVIQRGYRAYQAAKGAKAVLSRYVPNFSNPFATPKGKRRTMNEMNQQKFMSKKRYGTSTGRHSGFISKYRPVSRVNGRRHRKAVVGVQFCRETRANVTDNRCVWIGQHTMPTLEVIKYTCYALLKRLFNKAGIQFSSFDDSRAGSLNDGYIIGLEYRASPLVADAAVSYTVVAGDLTFQNVCDGFWLVVYNTFIAPGVLIAIGTQTTWTKLYLNDGIENTDQLMLSDCKVSITAKSALKMQNRSINTVDDDESSDVNNVPLIGKSYELKGNTFIPRDLSARNTVTGGFNPCSPVTGLTTFGAGATNSLAEPPEQGWFVRRPTMTKVSMQPGAIKTSVINETLNINFSSLLRYVNGVYRSNVGSDRIYAPIGKSRFFALERTIGRLSDETEPGISVTLEHDLKFWIGVYIESGTYSGPINIVG